MGVEIYPGFAGDEVIYDANDNVVGVATGDAGISKSGEMLDSFTRGIELRADQVIFAEGCRGSLTQSVINKFGLNEGKDPQSYGIGLKEVWEIDPSKF
mmetsp:Transcript_22937/g.19897  ORF Transcript_22937/g.19897 Transcript_22937/m.19897 type:complete len:98 (+) Transcript_22937:529-822(+)